MGSDLRERGTPETSVRRFQRAGFPSIVGLRPYRSIAFPACAPSSWSVICRCKCEQSRLVAYALNSFTLSSLLSILFGSMLSKYSGRYLLFLGELEAQVDCSERADVYTQLGTLFCKNLFNYSVCFKVLEITNNVFYLCEMSTRSFISFLLIVFSK